MNNDTLSQLRTELAAAAASLKQCTYALKGLKTFKNSPRGLEFCAEQLLQGAVTLRGYVEELVSLAENLHESLGEMPQQLELEDLTLNDHA